MIIDPYSMHTLLLLLWMFAARYLRKFLLQDRFVVSNVCDKIFDLNFSLQELAIISSFATEVNLTV